MKFALRMIALAGLPLLAHDLYLRPAQFRVAPGQAIRIEFHNGEAFPVSQVPTAIARIRGARLASAQGESPIGQLRVEGQTTVGQSTVPAGARGTVFALAETSPNFIALDAEQFTEYLRHEGLDKIVAQREQKAAAQRPGREIYRKFAKALLSTGEADEFFRQPQGLTLEFIPLANPARLAPGARLPIQVLYRGKPAGGQRIESAHVVDGSAKMEIAGVTDAEGKLEIPVPSPGLWKLHTVLMEPHAARDGKADWDSYWADFSFEIPAEH